MPHASLTETFCSRLLQEVATFPAGAVIDYHSTKTAGLSLRARGPSKHHRHGLLSWRFAFRSDGKQIVASLGHYPSLPSDSVHAKVGMALALRTAAKVKARERKEQGLPAEKRNVWAVLFPQDEPLPIPAIAPTTADTFAQLWSRYQPALDGKSDSQQKMVRSHFRRFILPQWGARDIHSFDSLAGRRDIVDLIKVVRIEAGPVMGNRFVSTVSAFFNFLVAEGIIAASPATKLHKVEEQPRKQILTVPQLVRVWRAAEAVGGPAGRFVQGLLVVPARRNELAELPRSEVDAACVWTLPVARDKSKRGFRVGLPPLFQGVLKASPDVGKFVFSSTGRRPISGFDHIKKTIDAKIVGLQKPGEEPLPAWTFHDVRRSIATHLAELGVSAFDVDRLLNHALGKLTETYNRHDYFSTVTAALRVWNDHFSAALANPHYNARELEAAD